PSKDGLTLVYLNCWSSSHVGRGICKCVSHPVWRSKSLTAKESLEIATEYLTKQKNGGAVHPSFFISTIDGKPPPALFRTLLYRCRAISDAAHVRFRAIHG